MPRPVRPARPARVEAGRDREETFPAPLAARQRRPVASAALPRAGRRAIILPLIRSRRVPGAPGGAGRL